MKNAKIISPLAGILLALCMTSANAVVFDFIDLATAGKLGERGFATLSGTDHSDLDHFGMTITGHSSVDDENIIGTPDDQQFAYLDKSNSKGPAGLGVCKDLNGSYQCAPSSDDNVTTSEYLQFMFDQDVRVDNIWFNNNHDNGFNKEDNEVAGDDKVNIGINMSLSAYALMEGYAGDSNGIGSFLVKKGEKLQVEFNNEQFYISAMEVSAVPVPAAVWLFGTALIGFVGLGRRTSVA